MLARPLADYDVTAALSSYREHGWALLPRVASEVTLRALRERIDAIMLGEVVREGLFFQHDAATGRYDDLEYGKGWQGPSLGYRKVEKLEKDPLFAAWVDNPLFERLAAGVIDGAVTTYRAAVFNKSARGGSDLPWHQDAGLFWGLDRDPPLQVWTALDDASADAGCIQVVPGTHLAGLVTPAGGVVPKAAAQSASAEDRALAVPARAGDVVLIHNYLWHRSGRNVTTRPRRAFTVCYMSAATRCTRTRRAPRTFRQAFTASEETRRSG